MSRGAKAQMDGSYIRVPVWGGPTDGHPWTLHHPCEAEPPHPISSEIPFEVYTYIDRIPEISRSFEREVGIHLYFIFLVLSSLSLSSPPPPSSGLSTENGVLVLPESYISPVSLGESALDRK